MARQALTTTGQWGLSTEKFFYFFMGLRKGEIRKQVQMMKARFPDDDPAQLARRFVAAQTPLSLLGGALMHLPMLVPALGPPLKLAGIAMGSSVMIRLNMTLLLQIAMLYGHDIDDRARLKEMAAIIAASGLASGTSLFPYVFNLQPRTKAILGGASVMTVSQLLGTAAIRYYGHDASAGAHAEHKPLRSVA
ncbi:MAG: hypothetical protein PVH38_08250 [Gammaproteobacteria bacterium]|jgi:hypothetical protein